jgi:HK97 gp10 family phage protein
MSATVILYGKPLEGTDEAVEKTIEIACIKAMNRAAALSPVDSGLLRNSISYKTSESAQGDLSISPKKHEGYIGTNVEYARYVEYGTRRQVAQPFLRPAIKTLSNRDVDIIKAIQKAIKDSVKKGARKV